MVIGRGFTERLLKPYEIQSIVRKGIDQLAPDGKRVLVLIPDGTRTMPVALMFDLFEQLLKPRTNALDYLIALGTHPPMDDIHISKLVGRAVVNGQAGGSHIYNHQWNDPAQFAEIGSLSAKLIAELSDGLMEQEVAVKLNKLIFEYDILLVCGPVFPHEVVGFSGGNKYFFPGIAGPEMINFTHWLGALITNYKIIGSGYTPVRAIIDQAAALIPRQTACFALVTTHSGVSGMYFGSPEAAWQAASALSAKIHITYIDRPLQHVLSVMPTMYADLWTAAKGMYKLEPVIADGGEVVIYAPHISEVSYTHGQLINEIGYHCCDYYKKQWDKYCSYPGGVLAHSTHLKGLGSYDAETHVESPRIKVTLATGIPEERCKRINLGYMEPRLINLEEWLNREEEGIFVAFQAGETLYRLTQEG